jgi:hypothetical protein
MCGGVDFVVEAEREVPSIRTERGRVVGASWSMKRGYYIQLRVCSILEKQDRSGGYTALLLRCKEMLVGDDVHHLIRNFI